MENRNGIKWTREETILALELYCRTSFSQIKSSNPEIIELAKLMGRTPGSVGLKMHNLAHYDPELKARNVTAMAHGSKLDYIIFEEFSNNYAELSYQAQLIKSKRYNIYIDDIASVVEKEEIPAGRYHDRLVRSRIGQYYFRVAILNAYNQRCCITGLNKSELLIASHIKPWNISDELTERTNPSNGLCLNSFHDKAFDKGYITIDRTYRIVISSQIVSAKMDSSTRVWFMNYNGKQITLPDKFLPGKDFIEYHNDVIFLK